MNQGETGIVDPCEKEIVDVTENLSNQQREELTASAHVDFFALK